MRLLFLALCKMTRFYVVEVLYANHWLMWRAACHHRMAARHRESARALTVRAIDIASDGVPRDQFDKAIERYPAAKAIWNDDAILRAGGTEAREKTP